MGTMGTLAIGIGSWLKFGKNTMSIAAGGSRDKMLSTSSDLAGIASTQLNKVKSNQR